MIATALNTIQDLKQIRQWVCHNAKKEPFQPSGNYAKSNDPSTWSSYTKCRQALRQNKMLTGVGFVTTKEIQITVIDLDKCIDPDGTTSGYAQSIQDRFNSYTEKSVSGTGKHIWVRGSIPGNIKVSKLGIEMYSGGQYLTVTESHIDGTPETFEDRQEELNKLYAELVAAQDNRRQITTQRGDNRPRLDLNDRDLIEKASNARNGHIFAALWSGDTNRYNDDHSAADQALCNLLAFWTAKDAIRMDRLFRESGLYRQAKWDRRARSGETYGQGTITRAIEACDEVYTPYRSAQNTEQATPQKQATMSDQGGQQVSLCDFDADDAGNGDAMYHLYGQEYLWCASWGWLMYTGTHWAPEGDGSLIRQRAVDTLRARRHAAVDQEKEAIVKVTKADDKRINGCINRFKSLVSVSIDVFDKDPNMLNCQNGIVDLRNGHVTPHDQSQRYTYCLPVEYGPADCPEWFDYLNGVVGGGQEVIDYLQKALGYSLTGHTSEEVLFYLFGPTRSGKGTLSEVFMSLLPNPLATSVDFNSFTTKREGDVSNFDLAPLKPSRMIFASESNRSQSLNPAKIKQLTGGDQIRACYKHRDFFAFRPQFKVWMLSNHPVNGDPDDDALWGRVRVIEFPHSFLGMEDKSKKARLKHPDMLKGILYWAVQGAIAWYQLGSTGLSTPQSVKESTRSQRAQLDYVQQWLDECCQDGADSWTPNNAVAASYLKWCEENNIPQYSIKGQKDLALTLKAKGYQTGVQKKVSGKNSKGVKGFQLVSLLTWADDKKVTGNDGNVYFPYSSHGGKEKENIGDSPVTSVTRYPIATDEKEQRLIACCTTHTPQSEHKAEKSLSQYPAKGIHVTTMDGDGYTTGNTKETDYGLKVGVLIDQIEKFYFAKMVFEAMSPDREAM